jgi:hypothetical protein
VKARKPYAASTVIPAQWRVLLYKRKYFGIPSEDPAATALFKVEAIAIIRAAGTACGGACLEHGCSARSRDG